VSDDADRSAPWAHDAVFARCDAPRLVHLGLLEVPKTESHPDGVHVSLSPGITPEGAHVKWAGDAPGLRAHRAPPGAAQAKAQCRNEASRPRDHQATG
jgi:hypothetical protein